MLGFPCRALCRAPCVRGVGSRVCTQFASGGGRRFSLHRRCQHRQGSAQRHRRRRRLGAGRAKIAARWQRGAHRCRNDRDRWRCGEYGSGLDVAAALLATCCRGRTRGGGPGRPCAARSRASSRRWPCPHRAGIARRAGYRPRAHRETACATTAAMGEGTLVGIGARASARRPARARPGPHAVRRRPAVRCARRATRHRQGRCEPRSPRGNCRGGTGRNIPALERIPAGRRRRSRL